MGCVCVCVCSDVASVCVCMCVHNYMTFQLFEMCSANVVDTAWNASYNYTTNCLHCLVITIGSKYISIDLLFLHTALFSVSISL